LHRSSFGPVVFDKNWLLGGVAGHTLLSPYLVQQTFGSLLVLSIAAFLHGRPYLAGVLIAVASTVHPVYLFPGAGLTLAYMLVMLRRGEGLWRASLLGATTLILVLPVTGLVFSAFGPTTPESYARAHEILATFRSPHHALLERWLWSDRTLLQADPAVKLGLVLAGIFLSRHSAMAPILAAPLLLTLGAIAYVAVSGDYSVAHAYPWRSFALLVPVATASITANLIARLGRRIRGELPLRVTAGVALLVVGFLAIGGIRISAETFARRKAAPWAAVADFVRETATEEDLYLIPPLWKPLWDFRINSGARVFVDWKSPAIKDVEVLEWFERLQAASAVYEPRRTQLTNCEALGRLVRDYPVTHIVTAMPSPGCPGLRQAYYDGRFAIYRRIAPR